MSFDNLSAAPHEGDQFGALRQALAGDAQTPEIVAIFQQIKNLRESDRSLRSIRRNLELDNIPVLDPVSGEPAPAPVEPVDELSALLDSFIKLKQEKEALSDRLAQMISTTDQLEAKVNQLTTMVEGQGPARG